jgi:hypothetical protein
MQPLLIDSSAGDALHGDDAACTCIPRLMDSRLAQDAAVSCAAPSIGAKHTPVWDAAELQPWECQKPIQLPHL